MQPPNAGLDFFQRFRFSADKVSISNTQTTDQEWSVGQASILIVKGIDDLEPIQEALKEEGVYPILCQVKGEDKPKALASIWINELQDSVCGKYHEYVISFDIHKSRQVVMAFTLGLSPPAFACWYNNFGDSVCEAQFLHSLYINSPLSIAWGREMQAFPKHPEPVQSVINLDSNQKVQSCDMKWGDKTILQISTEQLFGLSGFMKEGAGLVSHLGPAKVMRFLGRSVFSNHIVMPQKTAKQANRPVDYTAHIWKGLHPTAVKLWPWNPKTYPISLSDITKETGCEDNNGSALLKKANYQPLSVCSISGLSAVVTLRE